MELVLDTIKYICSYAKENEEEFTARVKEAFDTRKESSLKGIKSDIAKKEKRSGELNNLIKKIYEDNVSGKLSDKRFQMFLSDYEKEQEEVDNAILSLKEELENIRLTVCVLKISWNLYTNIQTSRN